MSPCKPLVDPRCVDLAEHFLSDRTHDHPTDALAVVSLAAAIQHAVEAWFGDETETEES